MYMKAEFQHVILLLGMYFITYYILFYNFERM